MRPPQVWGPIQDDEALLLLSLVRAMGLRRILEVGGLRGESALNFLRAAQCLPDARVYTLDRRIVHSRGERHTLLQKDARNFTPADVGAVTWPLRGRRVRGRRVAAAWPPRGRRLSRVAAV